MIDVAEIALTDDEFNILAEYASACDLAIGEAAHHLIVNALPGLAGLANSQPCPEHILSIRHCVQGA